MIRDLSKAGVEPELAELMNDPILKMVLKRDGISAETVCTAARTASQRLKAMQKAA